MPKLSPILNLYCLKIFFFVIINFEKIMAARIQTPDFQKTMARTYNNDTLAVLKLLSGKTGEYAQELFKHFSSGLSYKDFYNILYRLDSQELIQKVNDAGRLRIKISGEGERLLSRAKPQADGIWKLVIFDIPEKQKYVRTILRAKLKALHFKKWQNSIWVSPYALDPEIEDELKNLAKKFFVRLIKTTQINETQDLEKMFKE